MELETREMDGGITMVLLRGRMDMRGAQEIDLQFTAITTARRGAYVIDMSGVDFLASIGIRTLLVSAKGAAARGGKLVLYRPTALVAGVLGMAGISEIVPMFHELDAACAAAALS